VRVVADTNVLVSGLLWPDLPAHFLDAAQAQTIVTGDKDLLVLGEFQAVVITTPRIFLATLGL
jgi:predicted nucleic acid-binding protein